jgi:subtilisin
MMMNWKVRTTTLLLATLPGLALSAEKSVIIGFKQKPGLSDKALVEKARGKVKHTYQLIPAMAASLPEEEIDALKMDANVAYVEEDAVYTTADATPSDVEYDNSWGVTHISADVAHAGGNLGAGVTVAVLDTGIDYDHEDLNDNYLGGHDFAYGDDDPFDNNPASHGTHVAGIVAGEANGLGIVGVAPEVGLLVAKVLDGAGFGKADWIIQGIEWAVQSGADVINMSLQGPPSQGLQDACEAAYKAGVLLVAAGGNTMAGGEPVKYPAAYDSVVAVTAVDSANLPGDFAPVGYELELAAPGVDVLSTVAGGGYDSLDGTSQAAPHVSGTAALYLLSNTEDLNGDGSVNHEDVRFLLQLTATDLGAAGRDDVYGYGVVNAAGDANGPETAATIIRTSGSPANDAKAAAVTGMAYGITITNHGLNKVAIDVYEGDVLRTDLSDTCHFSGKKPQQTVVWLDATGTDYDVVFTPYGKQGRYAKIVLGTDVETP